MADREAVQHLLRAAMALAPNGRVQEALSGLAQHGGTDEQALALLGAMSDGVRYGNWLVTDVPATNRVVCQNRLPGPMVPIGEAVSEWFADHGNLVLLTAYMAEHGRAASDLAYAVEKPWKYADEWQAARAWRDEERERDGVTA